MNEEEKGLMQTGYIMIGGMSFTILLLYFVHVVLGISVV